MKIKILISCAKTSYTGLKNNIKEKRIENLLRMIDKWPFLPDSLTTSN